MTTFMQRVANLWYRLYWGWMLLYSVALGALYVMVRTVPDLGYYADKLALTPTAMVLIGIHIAYSCTLYWYIQKRDLPLATLISAMLFALMLMNGFNQTDPSSASLVYIIAWFFAIVFNGVFGLPLILGGVLLTLVPVLISVEFHVSDLSTMAIVLSVGNIIAGLAAYLFWKKRFINTQDQAVNQLSGMLRSNRQQSEILIQSIADGVIVFNTEGKITLMNPSAAVMTEWPVQEASGIDVKSVLKIQKENGTDIITEEDPFTLVLKQKQHINQTVQLLGRDGKKQVISLVISPVMLQADGNAVGAVAVMRDVSEQRVAEQQRAEFISTASHEMRTPVAAIEGYLALALNEKVSTIDSRARSYLEKAHSSTQHLGKLFQDLLTSSKAEDGRLTNHPGVIEMGAYMQQLSEDLKFSAEKRGLLAEFVIGSSDDTIDATSKDASSQHLVKPLYYTYADPDRMREVITNIFDNACKYTEQGKISIGLTGNEDVVQLYVRDTGPGIPSDDLPHLFQKFYRVDNSATRTIGGTGLGLFICRKIVELYHGRIWAESEVGKGSTFFINLPRLTTARAQELQAAEASKTPAPIPSTTTLG